MKTTSPKRFGRLAIVTASAATLSAVAFDIPMAHARSVPVIARGNCTGGGTWKLKAKHDDGRIEVEFEVDINRNGQAFAVSIKDNGVAVFTGNRTTAAPSGSFSVERRITNRAGTDRITARATRGTRVCSGAVSLA